MLIQRSSCTCTAYPTYVLRFACTKFSDEMQEEEESVEAGRQATGRNSGRREARGHGRGLEAGRDLHRFVRLACSPLSSAHTHTITSLVLPNIFNMFVCLMDGGKRSRVGSDGLRSIFRRTRCCSRKKLVERTRVLFWQREQASVALWSSPTGHGGSPVTVGPVA